MGAYLEKYENEPVGLFAINVMKIYLVLALIAWIAIMAL